jgi:hypothetical protein
MLHLAIAFTSNFRWALIAIVEVQIYVDLATIQSVGQGINRRLMTSVPAYPFQLGSDKKKTI